MRTNVILLAVCCIISMSIQLNVSSAFVQTSPRLSGIISYRSNHHTLQLKMNLMDNLEKLLVGSLFPDEEIEVADPNKEFVSFANLTIGSYAEVSFAHNSLNGFLLQWGRALEKAQGPEKLPTPVFCTPFVPKPWAGKDQDVIAKLSTNANNTNVSIEDRSSAIKTSYVKISFQKTKRYLSRSEQKGLEKGQVPDRKGGRIDSWSPGGIMLILETVAAESDIKAESYKAARHELRLSAKRCDIDGDTVVKKSSERTIIRRLRDAIRIWNKMRSL